jgi:hypothetical protein
MFSLLDQSQLHKIIQGLELVLKDAPKKILVSMKNQLNISIHILKMEEICFTHFVQTSRGTRLFYHGITMEIMQIMDSNHSNFVLIIAKKIASLLKK